PSGRSAWSIGHQTACFDVLPKGVRSAGISSVVWCSGFRYDFAWVKLPILNDAGEPLHQRGVTQCPGLYFLGLRRTYAVSCWRASATMRLLLPNRSPRDIRTLAPSRAGHGHHPLLRARRERPRRRRAAEQSDELAPLHSITSSAKASNLAGASISRALAVLML